METVTVFKEGAKALEEAGGRGFDLCFQCALCTVSCPWNKVRNFMLRRLLRQAQFGLVELEDEDWWLCFTCGLCTSRCPRGVPIIDVQRAARHIMVEAGMVPSSLHSAMTSLASLGNPWSQEREKRTDWIEGLGVREFTPEMELLYFPCCTSAYDPRANKIAQASAQILEQANVEWGILGVAESCCGESIRKAGSESLFQRLTKDNITVFEERGVKNILVSSPHCYYTFKNEYPEFGGDYKVVHFTQYVLGLIKDERLRFSKEVNKRVTYHDPCYLGRHSGVYEEPREVLRSIPGVELVEMANCRETSLCCGGGGGRIWMETKKGERFSDLRLAEAMDTGAEVLVTACPYCLLNFQASALGLEDNAIEIMDISELVAAAL